jgi:hypothetical protein
LYRYATDAAAAISHDAARAGKRALLAWRRQGLITGLTIVHMSKPHLSCLM